MLSKSWNINKHTIVYFYLFKELNPWNPLLPPLNLREIFASKTRMFLRDKIPKEINLPDAERTGLFSNPVISIFLVNWINLRCIRLSIYYLFMMFILADFSNIFVNSLFKLLTSFIFKTGTVLSQVHTTVGQLVLL
jgi:hypothetical protein